MPDQPTRPEHDQLGTRDVPANAYWGVHTLRAQENFRISGRPVAIHPEFVNALAAVKEAAAETNAALGLLDAERAQAIVTACREIRSGALHDQFVIDVVQGGAGTSTNMNANEVIANRALELLGRPRGDYAFLHPNDHVNLGQSTNDVYPTAVRLALIVTGRTLVLALAQLRQEFATKAEEYTDAVKLARTQLQDAVPLTLGQELRAYAVTIGEDEQRLAEALELLHEINLGGTAVGTGIASHPDFAKRACEVLAEITELPLSTAGDLVEATQDTGAYVQLSGVLKRIAVKLSKTCNDLRLLSSGPRGGLGDIQIPAVQAGSSIMPGKVNPVIPELVNQVCFLAFGSDVAVTMAAQGGQLQLNAFMPLIAHSLLETVAQLAAGCVTLAERCVRGITADRERLRASVERSIGLAATLNLLIGYEAATEIAIEARTTGESIAEIAHRRGLLTSSQLAQALDTDVLAHHNDE